MTTATKKDPYPQHTKLRAVKQDSQAIGEFIVWLESHGYYLCEKRNVKVPKEKAKPRKERYGFADIADTLAAVIEAVRDAACVYWPTFKRLPDQILAEYFGIDTDKLEEEKRRMLDEIRAHNEKGQHGNE